MSKRKPSSPYKQPPTPLVRELTQRGWRRCDAEGIVAVWTCVRAAQRADRDQLRSLGARATLSTGRLILELAPGDEGFRVVSCGVGFTQGTTLDFVVPI